MTCSDVQQLLPELLDGAPDAAFQTAFNSHVKSCSDCSDLVSDLKLITSQARDLTAAEEPPARVWVNIAAKLRAEGLIREPETVPGRPVLVPAPRQRRWSPFWLAPVAAGVLAAGAYLVSHKTTTQVAEQRPVASPVSKGTSQAPETNPTDQVATASSPVAEVPVAPPTSPTTSQKIAAKSSSESKAGGAAPEASAPSSAEDQQFLSVVSTLPASSRATYQNELQAVNADIQETQAYVNQNPSDADARQHLMEAYQQKALLYQIALDRIQ